MDAVPTLCAAGTIGVAAVGYVFGRPQPPTSNGHTSKRRKAGEHNTTAPFIVNPSDPTTPAALSQTKSEPPPRHLQRKLLRRPNSSADILNEASRSIIRKRTTELLPDDDRNSTLRSEGIEDDTKPFNLEGNLTRTGTTKSSWLRRLSNLSSSQNGSSVSSPSPGSPSISFSHGSSAAILLPSSDAGLATSPRNKLVKRTTSQRALAGFDISSSSIPRSQVPTLRRPATSHQRSATLQQQHFVEGPTPLQSSFLPPGDITGDNHDVEFSGDLAQVWAPLFDGKNAKVGRREISQQQDSPARNLRNETIKCITPNVNELPALMKADAFTRHSSDNIAPDHERFPSGFSRPATLTALGGFSQSTDVSNADVSIESDIKPRRSFSIGEMFSSPSPSTWKIAQPGALRKVRGPPGPNAGRRAASTPQPSRLHASGKAQPKTDRPQIDANIGLTISNHENPSAYQRVEKGMVPRPPSSPLPLLSRLSAFDLDLPDAAPSYPTSQASGQPFSNHHSETHNVFSSSPIPTAARNRNHRPSGVPSERASTLVGSDNENSRFLSGDEDDNDYQSETVFDSLRTGATGSSHSGMRGPRIETIFDESPPPELRKAKLAALQDLLSDGSFVRAHRRTSYMQDEDRSASTPVRETYKNTEADSCDPGQGTRASPLTGFSSSPPIAPSRTNTKLDHSKWDKHMVDDEDWSFDHDSNSNWDQEMNPSMRNVRSLQPTSSLKMAEKSDLTSPDEDREVAEQSQEDNDDLQCSSQRPTTAYDAHNADHRDSRIAAHRGPSTTHVRSHSVPISSQNSNNRIHNTTSKLDAWILGHKGVSEDWDNDFEFDEPAPSIENEISDHDGRDTGDSMKMLVPKSIMERQATFHGQYGQVKELTVLVDELEHLRAKADALGLVHGPALELWKEADGIISLATLNGEEDLLPSRSPHSGSFEFDPFEEDSPGSQHRRRSGFSPLREDHSGMKDEGPGAQSFARFPQANAKTGTPPPLRPRKESSAQAKSMLKTIHQQRNDNDPPLIDAQLPLKKLPFDTASLRDLVTRTGIVTRALEEIVRKAEDGFIPLGQATGTPLDPPLSPMSHQTPQPSPENSPRKGKSGAKGGNSNDNEINRDMKMMTVV